MISGHEILATSIIVCHNHPSGDPTPSPEDVAVTRQLVEAGRLLEVDVLDSPGDRPGALGQFA